MKMEQIVKDGKAVGIKRVFKAGDKAYEQIGDYICLEKKAIKKDYEDLVEKVLQQTFKFIKESGKVWDLEGSQFVAKTREDYENNLKELQSIGMKLDIEEEIKKFEREYKLGTLGFKVVISRIVEEGENV